MISGPNLDDYLEQGIHGTKEVKASERKRFLGTIRERIVLALLEGQVYENKIYEEVAKEMKQHPKAQLLLSGEIPYNYLSKYIKIANQHHIPFKIVENKEYDTDIGLVLAYEDVAIDKEEIFIEKKTNQKPQQISSKKENTSKGIKAFIKKILK